MFLRAPTATAFNKVVINYGIPRSWSLLNSTLSQEVEEHASSNKKQFMVPKEKGTPGERTRSERISGVKPMLQYKKKEPWEQQQQ